MPIKRINPALGYVGSCPCLACRIAMVGVTTPGRGLEGIKAPRKNKLGSILLSHLILPRLIQKSGLWHGLSIPLGVGIPFLSNKLHRQLIKLPGTVLKIPTLAPWVATLRFGMDSCDSHWVMDVCASRNPYVGNRKITLNRTNPTAPGK